MTSLQTQQDNLVYCFAGICNHLASVTGKFGGNRMQQDFESTFINSSEKLGHHFMMTNGKASINNSSGEWSDYRQILNEMIEYTSKIAGKKTIEKEIRHSVKQLEKEGNVNLYEASFKLDVLKFNR